MEDEIRSVEATISSKVPVQPPKKKFPRIVILLIVVLLFGIGGIYAGIQIGRKQISPSEIISGSKVPTSFPKPTEIISTPDETADWKIYKDDNISFEYPSGWKPESLQPSGSGHSQEIKDEDGIYVFTLTTRGNYNNGTGKPYKDLYEFINIPYKVKEVIVDGQNAVQPSPRAGGENTFGVFFFSKDSKAIINLILDTPKDGSKIQDGQKIFDQILSTFKFLDQKETKYVCPQNGWVDCMPIIDEQKKIACSEEAEEWYKTNCPDFKGFAQ